MLRTLRHRDFGLLWLGQGISLLGDGVYFVAIAWQVYDLSDSASALSLVGVAWTLPQVLTLLLAGVLADRVERRRQLVAADLLRCAAIGGIAALSLAGAIELWQIVALVVVYGIGDALFQPAFTGIVPSVVPADELLAANALSSFARPLALRFVGPALGGLLITALGVGEAFAFDAASFALSALAVRLIAIQRPALDAGQDERSLRADIAEGLAYVRERAWLWATLCMAALVLLLFFGPTEVLLPLRIRHQLGGDAGDFGLVLAAGGLGAILSSVAISVAGLPARKMTFMYAVWCLPMLTVAGYGLAGSVWQLALLSFVLFGTAAAGNVVWNTMIQTEVPRSKLGRVSSLDWLVSTGLIPVSFAITGPVSHLVGVQATLVVAGVLGSAGFAFLFVPGVRDPERSPAR